MDVDPPLSDSARYMREDMSLQGYRHLLAVGAPLRFFADIGVGTRVMRSTVLAIGALCCTFRSFVFGTLMRLSSVVP